MSKNLLNLAFIILMLSLVACSGGSSSTGSSSGGSHSGGSSGGSSGGTGGSTGGTGGSGGTGGGTTTPPPVDRVTEFVNLLNGKSFYDSSFYLVKRDTLTTDFVVIYSADQGYVAYDIKNYIVGDSWSSYQTYADYQEAYVSDTSYDYYSGETFYYANTYYNDFFGTYAGEFVFDETLDSAKDLEKVKAIKEAFVAEKIADKLVSEFGLSEERSLKVAKMASNWSKLSKKRSLTEADANSFSKSLIGVDMKAAERALKAKAEGNQAPMDEILEEAAKANDTSPEHMQELLQQIFQAQNS